MISVREILIPEKKKQDFNVYVSSYSRICMALNWAIPPRPICNYIHLHHCLHVYIGAVPDIHPKLDACPLLVYRQSWIYSGSNDPIIGMFL